jgi:transposase
MDIVHYRCAGLDISERDAKVCVRVQQPDQARAKSKATTWGSTTPAILALREFLITEAVTLVVMEATSDYWKPFYYLLDEGPFEVMLVNARHVKNLPGRKTDVSDAAWLAQLDAHCLVRASFVPPEPVRQLRDLTRTRTTMIRERSREIQRLQKLLEDAGVKLSSVATTITRPSGRSILDALMAGVRDPQALAELARGRLRAKIPELTEALTGRFNEHHVSPLARQPKSVVSGHVP